MIHLRPFHLILGGLAVAGVVRTATAILDPQDGWDAETDSAFLSAAFAAGSAGKSEKPEKPPAEPAAMCTTPEEMLQSISEERDLLEEQKARIATRESEVELAAEKLRIEEKRLTELKSEVETLLDTVKKAHTDDLDRLVALYSAMKPKQAAAIMDDLDIETSVMVLGTMPERDAAPILAQLSRVRARAISRIILERSKLPGDQRLEGLKL